MENNDFETILTVNEFDESCSFYHGLLAEAEISISSNFLMKFNLPNGKILKICAPCPLQEKKSASPILLVLDLTEAAVKHAIEFLMQHNIKFAAENSIVRTIDPAGNIIMIRSNMQCDLQAVSADNKTKKVDIS